MITLKEKLENGKILALEPVDETFEGKEVLITLADESGREIREGWEHLMETIRKNQIETDITDLAHQHDHYLYGTPKHED